MRVRKHMAVIMVLVLSVSVMTCSATALLLTKYYNRVQFRQLGSVIKELTVRLPESEQTISEVLKLHRSRPVTRTEDNILETFGYHENDFLKAEARHSVFLSGLSLTGGICLLITALWLLHRRETLRVQELTASLEKVNTGGGGLLLSASEDDFSRLQDEIYKTVTTLYQTRDAAVAAKTNYAENLANIAHQLKTPITAISLSAQMLAKQCPSEYPKQIQKQIKRLTHLEESLLLLSRIDAGTLVLKRESVDVFTVLTLAADNLQELSKQHEVVIEIPELGEMEITADMDWTMEAIMNLLRNCMEHTPPGKAVHCFYEQNPLYTRIRIWDEGAGFCKEDMPHLFERFYRGRTAGEHGIGIGLPLARAIMEMQNGVVSAGNLQDGGAYFEIRIYSH